MVVRSESRKIGLIRRGDVAGGSCEMEGKANRVLCLMMQVGWFRRLASNAVAVVRHALSLCSSKWLGVEARARFFACQSSGSRPEPNHAKLSVETIAAVCER